MEYGFVQKVQTFGIDLHTLWNSANFWDRPATLAFILQWGWGSFSSLTDMPYIENKKFHPFWRNHYPVNWLTTKSRWINICFPISNLTWICWVDSEAWATRRTTTTRTMETSNNKFTWQNISGWLYIWILNDRRYLGSRIPILILGKQLKLFLFWWWAWNQR